MKKNMGITDKTIRLVVAAILATLYFTNIITGKLGIAALIIALVFILTTFINFCPLYKLFGISTCKTKTT